MSDRPATANETAIPEDKQSDYQAHIYDWGRCIFCNVNDLDDSCYGPFECIQRGQFIYTTQTSGPEASAPREKGVYHDCFSR